jgi:hypothetical protein
MLTVGLAQCYPAVFLFAGVIFVEEGQGHGIFKYPGGLLKGDAVLAGVNLGFDRPILAFMLVFFLCLLQAA